MYLFLNLNIGVPDAINSWQIPIQIQIQLIRRVYHMAWVLQFMTCKFISTFSWKTDIFTDKQGKLATLTLTLKSIFFSFNIACINSVTHVERFIWEVILKTYIPVYENWLMLYKDIWDFFLKIYVSKWTFVFVTIFWYIKKKNAFLTNV